MKKTFNINLAGYPFVIDEDAYQMLNEYIETIRCAFATNDDSEEIASDIEARTAELLLELDPERHHIVTIADVSAVIERIGQPEEILEVETEPAGEQAISRDAEGSKITDEHITEDMKSSSDSVPPPLEKEEAGGRGRFRRKLFRDPQDALLGGVCSGLAAYLNIDPTIVRLVTVLLFFLSASTVIIAYIILWIVVPEARTPYQRMQMNGENPTVENIGRTVTGSFQNQADYNDAATQRRGFANFLRNVLSVFIKCLVILGMIIAIPVLLVLFLILLVCVIAFFTAGGAMIGEGIFGDVVDFSAPGGGVLLIQMLLATIGMLITLGIPFWLLVRMIFRRKGEEMSPTSRKTLLAVWIVGIVMCAVFTVRSVKRMKMFDWDKVNRTESVEEVENVTMEKETLSLEEDTIYPGEEKDTIY